MVKDIRIELLQNRANVRIGSSIISNSEFTNSYGWTSVPVGGCAGTFTFPAGRMDKTITGAGCAIATIAADFEEGFQYQVIVAVKNYNSSGSLLLSGHGPNGTSVTLLNSTIAPSGSLGTGSDYGTFATNWIQGATNLNQLKVYADNNTSLQIAYMRVYRTAVDKSSVFGVLDAYNTEDFPLALTFSVNDPANIDARKGAYSKTFQIPATKNNNKVLKNFNIANATHNDAQLYNKISCRILVGNLFSLTGLLQIQDVERLNDKPVLYSCVFLGDNLAWSVLMESKYLSDLQLNNSTNLKLSAKNIIESWSNNNAVQSTSYTGTTTDNTSPVTYPLTSYGRVNETGHDYGNGFQLYREQWEIDYMNNYPYNISQTGVMSLSHDGSEPVMDWRPLVWIYRMFHKIFNDAGYKISSSFVESDDFKKLLYASPNFLYNNANERKTNFTYLGNFQDASCAANQTNLKIFDQEATWTINVTNTVQTITYTNTMQTPYDPIRFGGVCGSGDGSGRFQPAPSVITTTAGQQQELLITSAAVGNLWTIPEAGFYELSTQNIMYHFNWGLSDWAGSGIINTSTSGMTLYGQIVVQVQRVGNTTWQTLDTVDNDSADHLGSSTFYNNSFVNSPWTVEGTLPASASTHYFNHGDKVRFTFGVAPKVRLYSPTTGFTGTTTIDVRLQLFGTTYDDWLNNNAGSASGIVGLEMVNEDTPVWGGTYNLQDVFPNDQKQIDFIKGVAHAFNLQFYTSEASKNCIYGAL